MHMLKEEVGAVVLLVPRGDGWRGDEEEEGARVDLGHGCVGDGTT